MSRERTVLLTAVLLAIAGCLTTAVMATVASEAKQRAASAEADAKLWKRQAGKAYTEMLAVTSGAGALSNAILIPAGTRIECNLNSQVGNGRNVSTCEGATIYPPRDY